VKHSSLPTNAEPAASRRKPVRTVFCKRSPGRVRGHGGNDTTPPWNRETTTATANLVINLSEMGLGGPEASVQTILKGSGICGITCNM